MPPFEPFPDDYELDLIVPDREYWETFYASLGAAVFIENIRIPETGPLDIELTAANLRIPVDQSGDFFWHAAISGLNSDDPIEIQIAERDHEKAMSFAHEIGHYFLYLTGHHMQYNPDIEEGFCEYFGRRLSMPPVDNLSLDEITEDLLTELCETYQVGARSLFIWLMENGVIPEQVIVDTRNPVAPNPAYSRKVARHILCICEADYSCPGINVEDPEAGLPILDLTSGEEIGRHIGVGHGKLLRPGDPEYEALQRKYS